MQVERNTKTDKATELNRTNWPSHRLC